MSIEAEMMPAIHAAPWTAEEFKQQLFAKEAAYHIHHPFNSMFHFFHQASPA